MSDGRSGRLWLADDQPQAAALLWLVQDDYSEQSRLTWKSWKLNVCWANEVNLGNCQWNCLKEWYWMRHMFYDSVSSATALSGIVMSFNGASDRSENSIILLISIAVFLREPKQKIYWTYLEWLASGTEDERVVNWVGDHSGANWPWKSLAVIIVCVVIPGWKLWLLCACCCQGDYWDVYWETQHGGWLPEVSVESLVTHIVIYFIFQQPVLV